MLRILIVDDNEFDRLFIAALIEKYFGYSCLHASSGVEAIARLKADTTHQIAAVLLDLSMPDMDGRATLPQLLDLRPNMQVIAITGANATVDVVDFIKLGAADYLTKPVNTDLFRNALTKAMHIHALQQEIAALREKNETSIHFADLIGDSPVMQTCMRLGQKAAKSDITVLITGESGTGKEMLARSIHAASNRADGPFVAVNCGALPKDLVESALFGHKKGAFTGAFADAIGKFMEANGGTLFLDEVGELPLPAQVKLLRALQAREIEPVGSSKSLTVNIRILAATNRDPLQAMQQGHLREDLFYRLNVFPIFLPPLRQRTGDIGKLSEHFLRYYTTIERKRIKCFDAEATAWMNTHQWPGNVRELENAIFRAVLLCDGNHIRLDHLRYISTAPVSASPGLSNNAHALSIDLINSAGTFKDMETIKTEVEQAALAFSDNNIALAAQQLGIGKSTLYRHRQI